jgi:hypothetical protein
MKKLIATTGIALTMMASAPANAGDAGDVFAGIAGVIILNEVLNGNNNNRQADVGVYNGQVYGNVRVDNYPRHGHGGHYGHGHGGHGHGHGHPPVYNNNTTIIIQDSAWASNRSCSEQIINNGDGSRTTLTFNCAGRVIQSTTTQRYN